MDKLRITTYDAVTGITETREMTDDELSQLLADGCISEGKNDDFEP